MAAPRIFENQSAQLGYLTQRHNIAIGNPTRFGNRYEAFHKAVDVANLADSNPDVFSEADADLLEEVLWRGEQRPFFTGGLVRRANELLPDHQESYNRDHPPGVSLRGNNSR